MSLYGILAQPAAQMAVLLATAAYAAKNAAKCRSAFSVAGANSHYAELMALCGGLVVKARDIISVAYDCERRT